MENVWKATRNAQLGILFFYVWLVELDNLIFLLII